MDRTILDLYEWTAGSCVRHPTAGLQPTTRAGIVHVHVTQLEVRLCQSCVLDLESDRRAAAGRTGQPYVPGGIGEYA